jgi:solute carrier family 25 aspartate/glutamate transporter 12/13
MHMGARRDCSRMSLHAAAIMFHWRPRVCSFLVLRPPNVILVMPEKALKLTMNDFFRSQLRSLRPQRDLPLWLQGIAGGLAGLTQVIATNPMELLKIQGATMAEKIKSGQLKEPIPYSTLIRQLGVTGMYTGVLATLARDVPFSMIYFSLFATSKQWLLGDTPPSEAGFLKPFIAGAIAGTVAAAATCPADVIKTRVHASAVPEKVNWRVFWARERMLLSTHYHAVISQEGYRSLFKGLVPRCAIVSPLFAITMGCYDLFQQRFG